MKTEMNKTIALYMGWKEMSHTKSKNWMLSKVVNGVEYAVNEKSLDAMRFDTSWDWLMPVIDKLRKQRLDTYGDTDGMGSIFSNLMLCNIELTHKYVANHIASLTL